MKAQCIAALVTLLLLGQTPGKTIPNHAIADLVLGQPDFTTNAVLSPTNSFGFDSPLAVTVDPVSRKVFVADFNHGRVLRYPNASALANGAGAEAVFGQESFSDGSSGALKAVTTRSEMAYPQGLFLDRLGRLWVSDAGYNRILMFEAASYRNSQPSAERVFGQPDFTIPFAGTTSQKMKFPTGIWVDANDTLWVADTGNNRVLRFDTVSNNPTQNSAADAVLGQPNFTSSTSRSGAAGLQAPVGVAMSGSGALFVVCADANRVLRFNGAGTMVSGLNNASAVFGQLDFTGTASGLSATQMDSPQGATITPDDSLWVCDTDNHRITRFDLASTRTSGAAANGVVGQSVFTTKIFATSNRGVNKPYYPFIDATGSLWVPDTNNNRILRFPPDVTRPALKVTSTVPKSTTAKTLTVKGTASDTFGITKVSYRVNSGSTKTATGTTNWNFKAGLKDGKNTITINSVDSVSNKSTSKVLKIERK